jgi:hypothetical protein
MAMLNLPPERRKNRQWQKDFFRKQKVDIESLNLKVTMQNSLNSQALRSIPVEPLKPKVLREVIRPGYVKWINGQVRRVGPLWKWLWKQCLMRPRKVGIPMRLLGLRDEQLKAYFAYLTLKPIELVIERRNQKCQKDGVSGNRGDPTPEP